MNDFTLEDMGDLQEFRINQIFEKNVRQKTELENKARKYMETITKARQQIDDCFKKLPKKGREYKGAPCQDLIQKKACGYFSSDLENQQTLKHGQDEYAIYKTKC